jgi:hypothetical protein
MNRRGLLKIGLWGGAFLAAGSTGLLLWPTRRGYSPRGPLRVFDAREFAVLAAVAARTVGAPGVDPVAVAHGVDETVSRLPAESQKELRQLTLLFENALAGLLFDGHFGPFTSLPPAAQDAVLLSWRDSKLAVRRTGYTALRKLTQAAYYANPSCWSQVGYPGPPQISQPT